MMVLVPYIVFDIFFELFAGIRICNMLVCGKVICSDCSVKVASTSNGLQVIIGVSVLRFVLEDAGIIF